MPRSLAARELFVNGKVMRVTYPYGWERAKRATNGSTLAARHHGKGASRAGAAEKYRFPWARSSCLNIWTTRHACTWREAKKKAPPPSGDEARVRPQPPACAGGGAGGLSGPLTRWCASHRLIRGCLRATERTARR